MRKRPDSSDDLIDSRDVIEAIAEIESELEDEDVSDDERDELTAELATLTALAEECDGVADWRYGETLIRDSYFTEYAEQLADDIGAIDANAGWPLRCIDWKQASRELQMDYTSVTFDGVNYWVRA